MTVEVFSKGESGILVLTKHYTTQVVQQLFLPQKHSYDNWSPVSICFFLLYQLRSLEICPWIRYWFMYVVWTGISRRETQALLYTQSGRTNKYCCYLFVIIVRLSPNFYNTIRSYYWLCAITKIVPWYYDVRLMCNHASLGIPYTFGLTHNILLRLLTPEWNYWKILFHSLQILCSELHLVFVFTHHQVIDRFRK